MCSPASLETAYVQRASPTEPVVVTCVSPTLYAYVPNTSLVEKSTSRSTVSRAASAASSTLYVPIRFTRIVRTPLSRTWSTPAIAAQVVERDDLVRVDEPPRERRADEAGAAGDEDPLAGRGHAASLTAADPFSCLAGRLQVRARFGPCARSAPAAWPRRSSSSPARPAPAATSRRPATRRRRGRPTRASSSSSATATV